MAEPPLTGDDPPAWAVEGVHLCAYDPAWPARAARYADELRPVLDRWLLGPIEHVGSTAVPGLVAKPVIDLMAQAINPGAVARQAEQLKFRDALRADAALRDDYASVKVRLARSCPGDRERYTDEKAVFVTRALRDLHAAS